MPQATRARFMLVGCGCAIEAWAVLALQQAPGADIPRHVTATLAAWAVYVLALRLILTLPNDRPRWDLGLIFAIAIAVRVTLLFSSPSLSDDIYRAVWDARLTHQGVNPYEYAPGAAELAVYRDDAIWERVNHKEQRTPYPPLATILSAVAYALLPERLLAMQVLAALLDLAGAALLAGFLARVGGDPRRSLALAWSPLGALHFAHSGHNDAGMVAAVLLGALLLTSAPRWPALVALGAGTAIKGVPMLMVPAWVRATGPFGLVAWGGTCAAVALPFLSAGTGLVAGVFSEVGTQRFNDSLYLLLERSLQLFGVVGAATVATAVGAAAVVAAAAAAARPFTTPDRVVVDGLRVLGVYLLVAPVVEPWYFTWLAPIIALRLKPAGGGFQLNDAPVWLWLLGAATLTELTYLPGGSAWWIPIRVIEYGPAYALLAAALVRSWRVRGQE